jgi:hypothetical protein
VVALESRDGEAIDFLKTFQILEEKGLMQIAKREKPAKKTR